MIDPETLVSLRKAGEHHPTNEIPHCTADLSTAHLKENARTADKHNKQAKTVLDELSKATTAAEQSQQARRLTDAKTKLFDAIAQAEDLYQRTEANTNASETRVSLGAQLDTARNTLHTATDINALNKAGTTSIPSPSGSQTPSNRQKKHQPRQPNHPRHPNHNPHPSNSSHQPAPLTQRQSLLPPLGPHLNRLLQPHHGTCQAPTLPQPSPTLYEKEFI